MEDETKIGARNSRVDAARLQAAHDALVEAGVTCSRKSIDPDETMVSFGGEIKALSETVDGLKVGGYLVRFSTGSDPDLTGDFFTAQTDFGDAEKADVWFHHCSPIETADGKRAPAYTERLSSAKLTKDEFGIWAETVLQARNDYEKFVQDQTRAGKMGWSSGTAGHLVQREATGKAHWIKRWIIGDDASLTPTPAEPRNMAVTLKSLIPAEPEVTEITAKTVETKTLKEPEMADIVFTPEELAGLKESLATLESGMEEMSKSLTEMKRAQPASVSAGAVTVTKDASDQPFKNQGEFFQAVKNAALNPMSEDLRLKPLKATGASEGVPADGGYLVAPQTAAGIQQNMFDTGAILGRVNMVNVTGNSMTWNLVDETSRASSLFGGVVAYWMAEAGTKTASMPKFKQLELKLKKLAALCYATDELLADATALNGWLTGNVPSALTFAAEAAIFYGDGVGKPQGIVGAPGTVSVTRVDGSKVQLADVVAMYARRLGTGPFAWYINRDVMPQLMQLGSTYQFSWMPPGGLSDSPYARLLGFPVIEVEYASTLGTVGDIVLADMNKYQAIQKAGGVETASSIHVKFITDETAFRFVYRMDGAPILSSAITPHKGSNTQSPFVTLTSAT